jgi:hypothetical protein
MPRARQVNGTKDARTATDGGRARRQSDEPERARLCGQSKARASQRMSSGKKLRARDEESESDGEEYVQGTQADEGHDRAEFVSVEGHRWEPGTIVPLVFQCMREVTDSSCVLVATDERVVDMCPSAVKDVRCIIETVRIGLSYVTMSWQRLDPATAKCTLFVPRAPSEADDVTRQLIDDVFRDKIGPVLDALNLGQPLLHLRTRAPSAPLASEFQLPFAALQEADAARAAYCKGQGVERGNLEHPKTSLNRHWFSRGGVKYHLSRLLVMLDAMGHFALVVSGNSLRALCVAQRCTQRCLALGDDRTHTLHRHLKKAPKGALEVEHHVFSLLTPRAAADGEVFAGENGTKSLHPVIEKCFHAMRADTRCRFWTAGDLKRPPLPLGDDVTLCVAVASLEIETGEQDRRQRCGYVTIFGDMLRGAIGFVLHVHAGAEDAARDVVRDDLLPQFAHAVGFDARANEVLACTSDSLFVCLLGALVDANRARYEVCVIPQPLTARWKTTRPALSIRRRFDQSGVSVTRKFEMRSAVALVAEAHGFFRPCMNKGGSIIAKCCFRGCRLKGFDLEGAHATMNLLDHIKEHLKQNRVLDLLPLFVRPELQQTLPPFESAPEPDTAGPEVAMRCLQAVRILCRHRLGAEVLKSSDRLRRYCELPDEERVTLCKPFVTLASCDAGFAVIRVALEGTATVSLQRSHFGSSASSLDADFVRVLDDATFMATQMCKPRKKLRRRESEVPSVLKLGSLVAALENVIVTCGLEEVNICRGALDSSTSPRPPDEDFVVVGRHRVSLLLVYVG